MEKQYVELVENDYRIRDTRISLESIIIPFLDGLSPEVIASECFPSLSLEQVYGAITFFLAHRAELEAKMEQSEKDYVTLKQSMYSADTTFSKTLHKILRTSQAVHV